MDSINITDPAFSLESDILMERVTGDNYKMFFYIGVAVLAFLFGVFTHRYYKNNKESNKLDCEGGFCNMSDRPNQQQH